MYVYVGLFYNNGYDYTYWRVPGVLQYFAFSYGVTSCTILICYSHSKAMLKVLQSSKQVERGNGRDTVEGRGSWFENNISGNEEVAAWILTAYRYEWIIQVVLVILYLSISLGAAAPGCPRGYQGPGGIGDNGESPECTGGIHRWIDMKLFGEDHYYLYPTCQRLYNCVGYDPEGTLGSLTACTLTYLGLMTGRVLVHFKTHKERLMRWFCWSFVLLFLSGCLCGFSQNSGPVPINKNLWSTSFGFITAGTGILGLGICYVLIDIYHIWTGAPFCYIGMNSILFYLFSDFFSSRFPFSYNIDTLTHASLLQMDVVCTCCWLIAAYYCYKIKFFVKI